MYNCTNQGAAETIAIAARYTNPWTQITVSGLDSSLTPTFENPSDAGNTLTFDFTETAVTFPNPSEITIQILCAGYNPGVITSLPQIVADLQAAADALQPYEINEYRPINEEGSVDITSSLPIALESNVSGGQVTTTITLPYGRDDYRNLMYLLTYQASFGEAAFPLLFTIYPDEWRLGEPPSEVSGAVVNTSGTNIIQLSFGTNGLFFPDPIQVSLEILCAGVELASHTMVDFPGLHTRVASLENKVEALESTATTAAQVTSAIQTELEPVLQDLGDLGTMVATVQTKTSTLETKVATLETKVELLQSLTGELKCVHDG
jgi:hypothetical protein